MQVHLPRCNNSSLNNGNIDWYIVDFVRLSTQDFLLFHVTFLHADVDMCHVMNSTTWSNGNFGEGIEDVAHVDI